MARGDSGRFGTSPSGRFSAPGGPGSDKHSRSGSHRRASQRRPSETGRFPSGEGRRRTLSGEFDVQSSSRAIDLIEEASLHGSITISDGLIDVCFMFTRGGLRVISAGRPLPSLSYRLASHGLIGEREQKRIEGIKRGRLPAPPDTDITSERDIILACGMGVLPENADKVAREIISEVFLDCLFWDKPQYEATTGEPSAEILQRRDISAITLSLGIKDLLAEIKMKIRTVSEVRRTVASMDVIAEPTPKGREALAQNMQLGEGVAGRKRVALLRTITQEPGMGAAALAKRLRSGELEIASRLHEMSTEGFLVIARKPRDKKAELKRIREMEEAIDNALSQLLRRVRLATDAANAGEKGKAARHMARAGGILLKDGRTEEAVHTFKGALKHSDEDLEAREGFVQSLWLSKRDKEAAAESEELGRRYLGLNLPSRARKVLEKALGQEESSSTLDLLVRSYVKMRKPKLAADAGERLVNRLRREGKADEAREVAGKLLQLGDGTDKRKLLKAAGLDRRKAAALVIVGVFISVGFIPAKKQEESRQRYVDSVREVQAQLNGGHDFAQVSQLLTSMAEKIEPLTVGEGPAAKKAREVHEGLQAMLADCQRAGELYPLLPWQSQRDIDHVWAQIEALGTPRSDAFQTPFRRLRGEIELYRARANDASEKIALLGTNPEAFKRAEAMRRDFNNVPSVLRTTAITVELVTEPPGASVRYDGTSYSQVTPLEIRVPLKGSRLLQLTMDGYEGVKRKIEFGSLSGDEMRLLIELERKPSAVAVREPVDSGTKPDIDPRTGKPKVHIGVSRPKRPKKPKKPRTPQIELKEGYFLGEQDKSYEFDPAPKYFMTGRRAIKLPARYRAQVRALNRLENSRVSLVALDVVLYVYRSQGWKREKTVRVELSEPLRRPLVAMPGGKTRVGIISRTLLLDEEELFDEVKSALRRAMRIVINREKARRG